MTDNKKILKHFFEGCSQREIAKRMKVSRVMKAVHARINRCVSCFLKQKIILSINQVEEYVERQMRDCRKQ